jgi:DNA-binding MarR family transcriptional regulator
MNSQFTERNLVRLIRLIERYTSTSIGKILEQEGYAPLTARHLQVFENIDPIEGSNIVQLAHNAAISKQAMSKLVKDAATEGFVEVMPNPLDSRFIIVRLTQKGETMRQSILDNIVVFYDNLEDAQTISPLEIAALTDTLLKFLKHFETAAENDAA